MTKCHYEVHRSEVDMWIVTGECLHGNDCWNRYIISLWQQSVREADD